MSGAADPAESPGWARLERAASAAAESLSGWRLRAVEAEREVERLRAELQSLSEGAADPGGPAEELRALRAENALLTSRAAEARQRVAALLARLAVLERRR